MLHNIFNKEKKMKFRDFLLNESENVQPKVQPKTKKELQKILDERGSFEKRIMMV